MTADAITRRAAPGYWACEPAGGGPPVCRFSMIACALGAWEASMRGMGSDAHDPISGGSPVTAGPSASADFWEPRFQAADPSWGREPSARLVELLPGLGLAPGRAWDLGCAHGGDALWLASLGWHVTATDVSATAVSRVAAAAAERGLRHRITAEQHDLSRSMPGGTFHLVYACYFHTWVPVDRDRVLRDAAERVRPGGCLVVIDHGSVSPWAWRQPDGRDPEIPSPEQTLAGLGLGHGWRTETCERAERAATGPDGQTATVTDNVIVLRRA